MGGACSFQDRRIRRLATKEVNATTAWVLPLRLPVSGVRPNKAHTGLGVMSFWKILEYARNMFPQNELRLGPDQNMWMWSAGWLLQRGHGGSRSGNSFASLALVKCTLRTILSCINLCLAHGEQVCIQSSIFCHWSSATFSSLLASWCSLFVISNTPCGLNQRHIER